MEEMRHKLFPAHFKLELPTLLVVFFFFSPAGCFCKENPLEFQCSGCSPCSRKYVLKGRERKIGK
ncbi:hypothetical protein LEMLEM_LOCUS15156, partial [Lemmus lemmus]